jgi:hypothetical protein
VPFNNSGDAQQNLSNVVSEDNARVVTKTPSVANSGAMSAYVENNRDYTAVNVRDANPRNAMDSGTVHTTIDQPQHNTKPQAEVVVLNAPKLATGPSTHNADHDSLNRRETVVSNPNSNVSDRPELR